MSTATSDKCRFKACARDWDAATWAKRLTLDEIVKIRLCYTKHKRHRVAHGVIVSPGYRLMSFVLWLKIVVKLRLSLGENVSIESPLLVCINRGTLVPMTGAFMAKMDKIWAPKLGWFKATINSRRRGFTTAMVRGGIHMASITIDGNIHKG